ILNRALGIFMGKQRNSRDEPKAGSSDETVPPGPLAANEANDATATPRMALAGINEPKLAAPTIEAPAIAAAAIDMPGIEPGKIEAATIETPKIELASIDAPRIAPAMDELKTQVLDEE